MGQTAAALILLLLFVVAWSLYYFDPFLGVAFGVVAICVGIGMAIFFRGANKKSEQNPEPLDTAWNEEDEPTERERRRKGH
jgi:hypothetical protein